MDDNKEVYDVDNFQHIDGEEDENRYLEEDELDGNYENTIENYEEINTNGEVNNFNDDRKLKKMKKKSKKGNGFKIAILIIVCTLLTGIISSSATYLLFKNTISQKNVNSGPANFEADSTGLTTIEAFNKVAPAVVVVSNKSIKEYGGFLPTQEVEGIGSGFIINEEGYILTNYHVIEGAAEVTVTLSDKKEVKAKIVNYDQNQDIAMLKIIENIEVPAVVELGDSEELNPGEELIAIGTPLSKEFSQTVTKGIVSAVNRTVETSDGVKLNLIQTDTPINPGNSGGPLVNTRGQVVGINTMKLSGEVEGIGFAIPINEVKGKIDVLSKPIIQLGITIREINEAAAKQYDLEEGLYIVSVSEFSSAEKAGLKPGDLITKFDGKRVKTFEELKAIKDTKEIGDIVEMEILRDKKEKKVEIVLSDQQ